MVKPDLPTVRVNAFRMLLEIWKYTFKNKDLGIKLDNFLINNLDKSALNKKSKFVINAMKIFIFWRK